MLRLQVLLTPKDASEDVAIDMQFRIPRRAPRRGFVQVGRPQRGHDEDVFFESFFFGEEPGNGNGLQSFDDLLQSLQSEPRNDELQARMNLGGLVRSRSVLLDQVVKGRKRLRVIVVR
jgi:hypothetical protein